MINIGFIGTGNMGGALATAASKADNAALYLANKPLETARALAKELEANTSVTVCNDNKELISSCDYVFIGVKPQNKEELSGEIKEAISEKEGLVLITMMAGVSIKKTEKLFGKSLPVIRIMPNLPAMVGKGMILYTTNSKVTDDQLKTFLGFMASAGRFERLDEELFSAGSAVSGCGPAFASMFIESLADGGVACGLPRNTAITLAAQMCLGTASYILENGTHPDVLKDRVCSPGGTTIEGVRSLEADGLRSALIEAVAASCEKDKFMG